MTEEVIKKLNETIESQQEELHRAQAGERRRQVHQLLHEQLLKQNWDLREAREKSLNEMEELRRFQVSTYRNCKMKLIVLIMKEIFKMLNQYAVDFLTLPVKLCLSHVIPFLVEC